MIKVLFFAQIRELLNVGELTLELGSLSTVDEVRQALSERGEKWDFALESDRLLASVNQTICSLDSRVQPGDEIAFFPPVTGG
ncbi:molybdopterin synthase sulfur carrier subunit [Dongshaea marina]|uniref:molybdopterin synthase sulfur carrier subunit n=1 Tax=Dongshaea marina TaxID=2047966 RepID=UPI000D3E1F17|nr:molybdopterin synthase sulfur carrier subunit [Dongshaea marina]